LEADVLVQTGAAVVRSTQHAKQERSCTYAVQHHCLLHQNQSSYEWEGSLQVQDVHGIEYTERCQYTDRCQYMERCQRLYE